MDTTFLKSKILLLLAVFAFIASLAIALFFFLDTAQSKCETPEQFSQVTSQVYLENIKVIANLASSKRRIEYTSKQLDSLQNKTNKMLNKCNRAFQSFSTKNKIKAKHLTLTKIQHIYRETVWQNYIKAFSLYPQLANKIYDVTNITNIPIIEHNKTDHE